MATNSKNGRRADADWDDDDDLMLTQDDLALIDGLCSQQQFEEKLSHNGPDRGMPRTCSAPSGHIANGRSRVDRPKKVDLMAPVQALQSEIELKEMIVKLQQEVLTKAGLVAILQEEQRIAKESASSDRAAMEAQLKALKAESDRAAESLRSQLIFLTRENEEAKLELQRQRERPPEPPVGSQTPGPDDAVQATPSRSGPRPRRQLFPAPTFDASPPRRHNAFPTASSFHAPPPPKRALIAPRATTPLKRSASWLSNNSPTPEKPQEGLVSRARSSPEQQEAQKGAANRRRPLGHCASFDERKERLKIDLQQRRGSRDSPLDARRTRASGSVSPIDRQRRKGMRRAEEERILPPAASQSPLVRCLDARLSGLALGDERHRLDRRLTRALVALQDEMVSQCVDFSVLPPLKTYERQTRVDHPLSRDAQAHYCAFTKNYHKYISVTLAADSPTRLSDDEKEKSEEEENDEEDEEEEKEKAKYKRAEIKDWPILLHLLPCLANHVRLFANELRRRREYIADIDKDLVLAGGTPGPRICPVTGSGPMDEFFDIVKELDMTSADLSDCPHLLFTPFLDKFRKQVNFALRWLLTMHQYCSQLRPWFQGEDAPNFPQAGDLVSNLIRLLTDQRFYYQEESHLKRAALDLFCDICRRMPSERIPETFEGIRPFHLLLLCNDSRQLSTLRCFESLQHLVHVSSFRKDFDFHRGRRHCLWSLVFHVVNKLHRETWPRQRYCELIHLFASFAINAVRSKMRLLHRGCACNRGMYEALSTAALSQAQLMFYNRWESCTIEAVERPLRALLLLLQAQGVQEFEEITSNLFSLFALISMLKRVETCRGYNRTMKAAMDMQLINEFDDLDDDFHVGE